MNRQKEPYSGDVFFCESYPGLHNSTKPKDRYVIIVNPPNVCPDDMGRYLVVPTSRSTLSEYVIDMPNLADNPATTSGLPEPCRAVCDDFRLVEGAIFTRWVGDVRTVTVTKIQEEIRRVVEMRMSKKKA